MNQIIKEIVKDTFEYVNRLFTYNHINKINIEDMLSNIQNKLPANWLVFLRGKNIQFHRDNFSIHLYDSTTENFILLDIKSSETYYWIASSNQLINFWGNKPIRYYIRKSYYNSITWYTQGEDVTLLLIKLIKGYYQIIVVETKIFKTQFIQNTIFINKLKDRVVLKHLLFKKYTLIYYKVFQ